MRNNGSVELFSQFVWPNWSPISISDLEIARSSLPHPYFLMQVFRILFIISPLQILFKINLSFLRYNFYLKFDINPQNWSFVPNFLKGCHFQIFCYFLQIQVFIAFETLIQFKQITLHFGACEKLFHLNTFKLMLI